MIAEHTVQKNRNGKNSLQQTNPKPQLFQNMISHHQTVDELISHQRDRRRRDHTNQIWQQSTVKSSQSFTPTQHLLAPSLLPHLHHAVYEVPIWWFRIELLHSRSEHLQRVGHHRCTELGNGSAVEPNLVILHKKHEKKRTPEISCFLSICLIFS